MTKTIRVLVVDDHPVMRSGIAGLLEGEADFDVVGTASSGEEAVALAAELAPDVVLMDLRMPGMGGVEATRQIRATRQIKATPHISPNTPAPHVLVFTTYETDDQILAAIEAGAVGYLLKSALTDELTAGVRSVAAGQTVLAPSIAAQLVARVARSGGSKNQADAPKLTPRETEILSLVADGLSNPAIAARLVIGESTVKTHLLHVFEKLDVSDRTRAVTRALELGILPAR